MRYESGAPQNHLRVPFCLKNAFLITNQDLHRILRIVGFKNKNFTQIKKFNTVKCSFKNSIKNPKFVIIEIFFKQIVT